MIIDKKADWWNDAVSYLSDNDEIPNLNSISIKTTILNPEESHLMLFVEQL